MKKKPPARVKRSPAKPQKTNAVKKSTPSRVIKMTRPPVAPPKPVQDPKYLQAVESYQVGLKAMQERKFDKAKTAFQKVLASGVRDLSERANVFLNTCNQHMAKTSTSFKTPEEHYDYAISLMNVGDYVGAREHLDKIIKQSAAADYGWYGLSVLNCLTGHYEDALKHLSEAIRLNPRYRFQARNDSDFRSMSDDPRFTELIYPEVEEASHPARK
jgi:tetratricopeptide (TPR) repeat protein